MFKSSPIAGLFGRSPFGPTQKHMAAVYECAAETIPLFEALVAGDGERAVAHKERIFELEHRADELKNELRSHLPRSLFMPVDRRDLLDLLHAQDSIADTAQDVAALVCLRPMEVPELFREPLLAYVRRNVDAAGQCRKVINELDELVETGFGGREALRVEGWIAELAQIETETDDQGMELTRLLFEVEGEMTPGTFYVWNELIRQIGNIADYAEDVGDRLRLLIAR